MMKEKEKKEYFLPEAEFILYSTSDIIASSGTQQEVDVDDGNFDSDTHNNANQWYEGE